MTVKNETVKVWDPLVRIGHWALVAGFTIAYLTGEEDTGLHVWAGYGVATLVGVRIAWGFLGGRYARFRSFLRPPGEIIAYLGGLASGSSRRYLGHNPAGGAMAVALLLALAATCLSGAMLYAIEDDAGPFSGLVRDSGAPQLPLSLVPEAFADRDGDEDREYGADSAGNHEAAEEFWEDVHEFAANLTLALVSAHVLGVLASSIAHRENLPLAMVTGRKRRP